MTHLLTRYRRSINPPYNTKDLVNLTVTFCVLLFLPILLLFSIKHNSSTLISSAQSLSSPCQFQSIQAGDPPFNLAFCDSFDQPAGIGNRSGQLNGTVWGVSRLGLENGSDQQDTWLPFGENQCGTTVTVQPDNDVNICNGEAIEGMNDGSGVLALTMYPKQPFDITGRTGTVVFDVSNDTQGNHAAWPEFWYTDKPVPGPFVHEATLQSVPKDGLGVRFAGYTDSNGNASSCPEGTGYIGIDSVDVVRNYTSFDTFQGTGGTLSLKGSDCVKESSGVGSMNHYELRISQNQIDIYGTDAFSGTLNTTLTPLKHLATITNANLTLTKGLIWMEDVHYNAEKFNTQGIHTFSWDNVGFDGPLLPRDLAFDANDHLVSGPTIIDGYGNSVQGFNLGWPVPNDGTNVTIQIPNVSGIANATTALLEYNHYSYNPETISYNINNHGWHDFPWPYPDNLTFTTRTIAIPAGSTGQFSLAELQAGTNTIQFKSNQGNTTIANIDLIMVGAGGIVPPTGAPSPVPCSSNCITPAVATLTPTTSAPTPSPLGGIGGSGGGSVSSGALCKYFSNTSATSAFCDDFSEGTSPGGRAGDLDESKWSVGRLGGGADSTAQFPWPQTPVEPCKGGVSNVSPDNDIIMCDSSSGHNGQIEMATYAQNYGLFSIRPREMFDFTGRTGTITYNTDALTQGGLSYWTSVFVTDDPVPAANNSSQVNGIIPKNGIGLNFDDSCNTNATQVRVNSVFVYNNYVENQVPLSNPVCIQTQRGLLNHIEIRLSQTQVQIYASDFSTDNGQTFPNFRLIGSAPISLSISQGYVHFQQGVRAPLKYGNLSGFNILPPFYANNYWSDIGFDGPVVSPEVGYMVPDALTTDPNPTADGGFTGALNVGYSLLNNPAVTYKCCSTTGAQIPVGSFIINNVNLQGVSSAKLSFMIQYTYANGITPNNVAFHYRINNGSWLDPNPQPNYAAESACSGCPGPTGGGGVLYSFPIDLSSLVQGTNTLEFTVDNSWNSYPPVISSIDLLTFGGSASTVTPILPSSTPTPTNTPMPTPTPTIIPTNTPTPTIPLPTLSSSPTPTLVSVIHGLFASYFANQTLSGVPTLTRIDPTINFNWGSGSPAPSIPVDHFSVRWTGFITPSQTATYTLYTQSDDGVRLWVNNIQLVNNWTDHSSTQNSGKIVLTGGHRYPIVMEFYENSGQALAKLSWSSSKFSKRIIPSYIFTTF